MRRVNVRFEAGREWISEVRRVPATAYSPKHCEIVRCDVATQTITLEPGTILIENRRNGKGVLVSVVLPTGTPFPTGRSAPEFCWFQMLKHHLRDLLAMTPPARLVSVATSGIDIISGQVRADKISPENGRAAIERLEGIRAAAMGELYHGSLDDEVLKMFYAWMAGAASQLRLPQRDLLRMIEKSIRCSQLPQDKNADIDPDIFDTDPQRPLDI